MVYRLYRWDFSPWGFGTRPTRGGLLATTHSYGELVSQATRRARFAGYYLDNDWMYLFDWEKEDARGTITARGTRNQHPATPDKKRKRAHGSTRANYRQRPTSRVATKRK